MINIDQEFGQRWYRLNSWSSLPFFRKFNTGFAIGPIVVYREAYLSNSDETVVPLEIFGRQIGVVRIDKNGNFKMEIAEWVTPAQLSGILGYVQGLSDSISVFKIPQKKRFD